MQTHDDDADLRTACEDYAFLASAFVELQPEDAVALDIGANVGRTALLMARLRRNGKVLALEPSTTTFEHLEHNLRSNVDNASALRMAVGAANGEHGWVDDHVNSTASHLSSTSLAKSMVSVVTLDDLVQTRALLPTFIKIDVEGFELDVLEGGQRTLQDHRPILFVEMNSFTLMAYGRRNPRALIDFLLEHFARVFWNDHNGLSELRNEDSVIHLLHVQLTSGSCVNDLLCIPHGRSFDEGRLITAVKPRAEPPDSRDLVITGLQDQLQALRAEHDAVLTSRTWRLAIRLRRALARAGL